MRKCEGVSSRQNVAQRQQRAANGLGFATKSQFCRKIPRPLSLKKLHGRKPDKDIPFNDEDLCYRSLWRLQDRWKMRNPLLSGVSCRNCPLGSSHMKNGPKAKLRFFSTCGEKLSSCWPFFKATAPASTKTHSICGFEQQQRPQPLEILQQLSRNESVVEQIRIVAAFIYSNYCKTIKSTLLLCICWYSDVETCWDILRHDATMIVVHW